MKFRYSDILKYNLTTELDEIYEKYKDYLPAQEDLGMMMIKEVKEFSDPDAWKLQKCMKLLLFEEQCDPNLKDNYGEVLLNYVIKHHKQQSLRYILNSNNANINIKNLQDITPIGQAFISRNVNAVNRLLELEANIHASCIYDRNLTNKMMTPLHYFIKRIRLEEQLDPKDEEIMKILIERKIKVQN